MASSYVLVAATAIFLATHVLISLRTIRRFPIERPDAAMLGGALMLVFGVRRPSEVFRAIHIDLILLFVVMMALGSGLDLSGFFDPVSSRIAGARRAKHRSSWGSWSRPRSCRPSS